MPLREPMGKLVLFVRVCWFAATVPLLLRTPLPRLTAWLIPTTTPPESDPLAVERVIRYVDLALRLGRPLIRPTCLTRGLTLYYFLNRAGLRASLCFGVGQVGDEMEGHCWLTRDDEPFLEKKDPRPIFTETYRIPSSARELAA